MSFSFICSNCGSVVKMTNSYHIQFLLGVLSGINSKHIHPQLLERSLTVSS